MQAVLFLIDTAFSLYLMVVILRLWLQLVRADFYNPFSQFVVKATNPVIIPLRRLIPSLGKIDSASLVLALLLIIAKAICLRFIVFGEVYLLNILVFTVPWFIKEALTLLFWVLVIRALLSWFSQGRSPVEYLMYQLTEPVLRPVRNIVPPIGGLDLSILIVFIFLNVLNLLTVGWIPAI